MKKIFFILMTNIVFGQPITIDTSFGNGGEAFSADNITVVKTLFDKDDNIFNLGVTAIGLNTVLTKHNFNGVLDTSIGFNGVLSFPAGYEIYDFAIQNDNKIIVAGSLVSGIVARYTQNGLLDPTFGANGVVNLSLFTTTFSLSRIIIFPNQKILVTDGNKLIKLNNDGSPDISFGTNGVKEMAVGTEMYSISDFKVLKSQNIICVGENYSNDTNSDFFACLIDQNGIYVSSFDSDGKLFLDIVSGFETQEGFNFVEEFDSEKILISGFAYNIPILVKINLDGSFENSFGTNGVLLHNYSCRHFAVQTDEKVLLGCTERFPTITSPYKFAVTRLNSTGSIDTSFNLTGTFYHDFSSNDNNELNYVVLKENKLYGSGFAKNPNRMLLTRLDLGLPLTILENATSNDATIVYPNPVKNILNLTNKNNMEISSISIFNTLGQLVQTITNPTNANDVSGLKTGTYFVKMVTDKGITSSKFVKE